MSDGMIGELDNQPAFRFGEKVQSRKTIRNDGTYVGKDIGEILVRKGDVGYVSNIGTFLSEYRNTEVEVEGLGRLFNTIELRP